MVFELTKNEQQHGSIKILTTFIIIIVCIKIWFDVKKGLLKKMCFYDNLNFYFKKNLY